MPILKRVIIIFIILYYGCNFWSFSSFDFDYFVCYSFKICVCFLMRKSKERDLERVWEEVGKGKTIIRIHCMKEINLI